jgi:HD-GYP domain-containing protein (c-di-GMP phosphodiesterase class II)
LSDDEKYFVSLHAKNGADIAKFLCDDDLTADYVQHHHDRFDARSDPTADKVPLGARVLNVADAFATMITGRPYRPPRTIDGAMHELRRQSGLQFDPRVVHAVVDQPALTLN